MDEVMLQILGELKDIKAGQITMQGDINGFRADLTEVKADVAELKKDMVEVKADVAELKKDMVEVKADVAGLKADVAELKKDMVEVKQRVTNVEEHVEDMDLRLSTVAVVQENEVAKKIGLLMEGHVVLAKKLDRLEDIPERVEDIQSAMILLRTVLTEHIRG